MLRTARLTHVCILCGGVIEPKTKYVRSREGPPTGYDDFYTHKAHQLCDRYWQIADQFHDLREYFEPCEFAESLAEHILANPDYAPPEEVPPGVQAIIDDSGEIGKTAATPAPG